MPTKRQVLEQLKRDELLAAADRFGLEVVDRRLRDPLIDALAAARRAPIGDVLADFPRARLKELCRALGLDDGGREKALIIGRLGGKPAETTPPPPAPEPTAAEPEPPPRGRPAPSADAPTAPRAFADAGPTRRVPREGDVVQVRHRQYLVESVTPAPEPRQDTRVSLVCLDDDNQGRRLEVLWELELGARVLQPQAHGLGQIDGLDEPRRFAAYLNALRWHGVTATDARLFQAPFRAGIKQKNHQLTPLKRALELPRANLFIADDVGIGKTIEAGLVLQELLLRQRVELVLIVCPAAICLQWRDEMARRFGLHFELYNRAFIGRRRQERGFAVNPWSTHARFVISYQLLRRPEYRDPLLQHLGERARKSLLILDEAHTAAPASASKYAVDSRITRVVRDVAPRFENRLFLSATPHNGHSNSFSALLELLDPQRFTRGVKVRDQDRDTVMVRRLKSDLRDAGEEFPVRRILRIDLGYRDGAWWSRSEDDGERRLGEGSGVELELARLLESYTELSKPRRGRGQLVFINLQKRLLSSVEAFYRTLELHARSFGTASGRNPPNPPFLKGGHGLLAGASGSTLAPPPLKKEGVGGRISSWEAGERSEDTEEEYGFDDDAQASIDDAADTASSRLVTTPAGRARELLDEMLRLARQHRATADAKALALVDWIRRNQCPAVRLGGAGDGSRKWNDRRVIVFTEYGDTKRYLSQVLGAAIAGTEDAGERILHFHGGMSDDQREAVQRAFNGPPDEHPVRILIATDAAREGVNLQGHCADLFHFDLPWNPARLEQRNGRIDRTLQPSPEVRCHYFAYPQRTEDVVLAKVVDKVEIIRRDLGSLSAVILDQLAEVLDRGIDDRTEADLAAAEEVGGRKETTRRELEASRKDRARLKREIDDAGRILSRSRQEMDFEPALLRDAVDVGLELMGAAALSGAPAGRNPPNPPFLKGGSEPDLAGASGSDLAPPPLRKEGAGGRISSSAVFSLPDMPDSWQETLDSLRPARERLEPFWEWRKKPPLPVVFEAPDTMTSSLVHLHLEHPFVKRILARFLAQGYSAQDLNRVTVLRDADDDIVRVLAFGRLSLFGPGAARLHDRLLWVAAPWHESGSNGHLEPFDALATSDAWKSLQKSLRGAPGLDEIPSRIRDRLRDAAGDVFAQLWAHITEEAESETADAERKLRERGTEEAATLRAILATQRDAIRETIGSTAQRLLEFTDAEKAQREQFEEDRKYMEWRLERIDREIEVEPRQLEELYRVTVRRLEAVGLVFLWPESRL